MSRSTRALLHGLLGASLLMPILSAREATKMAVSLAETSTLHNGIMLPEGWPPQNLDRAARAPLPVPYLKHPPEVIPINVGRQLLVDNYLIESTSGLTRVAHTAQPHPANPILKPETPEEIAGAQACTFDDAVFYDPMAGHFKMYYCIGYYTAVHHTALAISQDGIHWERPDWGIVPGTNIIIPSDEDYGRDNFCPWLDLETSNPTERYKAYLYLWPREGRRWGHTLGKPSPEILLTSPDGIHWTRRATWYPDHGDCTSFFHDPFRRKYVLNVRSYGPNGRDRSWFEADQFLDLVGAHPRHNTFWLRADELDKPDPDVVALRGKLKPHEMDRILKRAKPEQLDRWFGEPTQLYTVSVAPYESLMLGVFTIHYGPENLILEEMDDRQPKLTQIKVGYSRDGFHFARPDREPFIAASKRPGDSQRAYLRAAGGGCVLVGDKLHFYYSAASGEGPNGERHLYAGGNVNLATLRRDGFVSYRAGTTPGVLITRPITFTGKHLFLNLAAEGGIMRVAITTPDGQPIKPFTSENCEPLTGDATRMKVIWRGGKDLATLAGRPLRIVFEYERGDFFSFWVSPDSIGSSQGYIASGGPGFITSKDVQVESEH